MKFYLIVVLGLALIDAFAKSLGWRPKKDYNWYHHLDFLFILIALVIIIVKFHE